MNSRKRNCILRLCLISFTLLAVIVVTVKQAMLEGAPADSPLYAKVQRICESAVAWRTAMQNNHTVKYYLKGS